MKNFLGKMLIMAIIVLFGCQLKVGYKQNYFWVEQGEHSFRPKRILQPSYRTLSWNTMFRDNCWYDADKMPAGDRKDINKLYGITSASIHKNSARIGWRAEKDSIISIFAYWYIDGNREFLKLGETNTSEFNHYLIKVHDNKYVFGFNDTYHTVTGVNKTFWLNSYRSYPYFGGNQPAPHFMDLIINEE